MFHDMKRRRLGISAIARRTGLDRKTVRKYLDQGMESARYHPRQPRPPLIDPYADYLRAHRRPPGVVRPAPVPRDRRSATPAATAPSPTSCAKRGRWRRPASNAASRHCRAGCPDAVGRHLRQCDRVRGLRHVLYCTGRDRWGGPSVRPCCFDGDAVKTRRIWPRHRTPPAPDSWRCPSYPWGSPSRATSEPRRVRTRP